MASVNLEYLFLKIYKFFTEGFNADALGNSGFVGFIVFMLSLISVICIGVIVYAWLRLEERKKLDRQEFYESIHSVKAKDEEKKENKQWQKVITHINSSNPSDWRLAIMESDSMLEALTFDIGLVGDTLGERLKNANVNHFKTLSMAWDAHKLRNKIAHVGLAHDLPYRDAKKAIEQYESVFLEFGII